MSIAAQIKSHAEVIGADGVHVGTVDGVEGDRIKLARDGNGAEAGEAGHRFIPLNLVAEVEGDRVRLSANGDVAVSFTENAAGDAIE